jgi:hypothetical protein
MTLKVSVAEIENLAGGDHGESRDGVELRVVEEGEWVTEGKYETYAVIFTDGERIYRGYAMRSGSYFTEYTWNSEWDDGDADIEEVAPVPVTVTQWQPIIERGFSVYETEYPEEGHSFLAESERADRPEYTVIGPAVRTASGWHAVDVAKEVASDGAVS